MLDPLRQIDVRKLDPVFLVKLRGLVGAAAAHGLVLLATFGFRSRAQQQALYDARKPGAAVAAPGTSLHEKGRAADFLAYRDGVKLDSSEEPEYVLLEELATRYGLRTGRSWKKPDGGHVELPA